MNEMKTIDVELQLQLHETDATSNELVTEPHLHLYCDVAHVTCASLAVFPGISIDRTTDPHDKMQLRCLRKEAATA